MVERESDAGLYTHRQKKKSEYVNVSKVEREKGRGKRVREIELKGSGRVSESERGRMTLNNF